MSTWSIADTRSHVANRFGESQLEKVSPSLHAMAQRQAYARYHFQEVRRLLENFQSLHLADKPLLVVAHGPDESARNAFQTVMFETGAHALACILSIHAIADVTAFAVYQALGYGLSATAGRERKISATKLHPDLRRTSGHEGIADLLEKLINDTSYKHICALANHSKHQGLVRPALNEDWTGEREQRYELRFAAFKHNGKPFPECELTSLLKPAYAIASSTVIDIGNQINSIFGQNVS
jgi:hypothetical protein